MAATAGKSGSTRGEAGEPILVFSLSAQGDVAIPTRIATDRLELIVLTDAEVADLQSTSLPAGLTWSSGYSRENLNLAIQTVTDARGRTAGIALITMQASVIGHIAFHAERSHSDIVWISYETTTPLQNKGFASEGVRAIVECLVANRITVRAEVLVGHLASKKVLEKAGLVKVREPGFGEIWERHPS